ncbi:hypothetical protein ACTUVK_000495 [Stenotrophomonas rhizophila]
MTAALQHKHTARVLVHEARARRGTSFSHVLLRWAGIARRRAAAAHPQPAAEVEPRSALPAQLEPFA